MFKRAAMSPAGTLEVLLAVCGPILRVCASSNGCFSLGSLGRTWIFKVLQVLVENFIALISAQEGLLWS